MHSGNRLSVDKGQHAPDLSMLLWRAGLRAKRPTCIPRMQNTGLVTGLYMQFGMTF